MSAPVLEARGLGFGYPGQPQRLALEGVDLRLEPGAHVGLVGPNGAGKSTLLRCLCGLEPLRAGGLWLAGQAVEGARLDQLHRQVGLVFQHADDMLFTPRVADDVAFGPRQLGLSPADVDARVQAALARVGAEALAERVPHQLSAGEKRRVALAAALALEPQVLLLDEPTSDLDPRGRRELRALLRELELTLLVASHDLEFVLALCDQVVVLDGGRVVRQGPAGEVLGDEPLMLAHGLERPHSLAPHAVHHRHDGELHGHGHEHTAGDL
ncbi:MAG: ABC transporter ATP-binding protein [Planctomycetota bacterium]